MYVLKNDHDHYRTADWDWSSAQRNALRFPPALAIHALAKLLFGDGARFVKLKAKQDDSRTYDLGGAPRD
jgi:hypothetical protein